MAKSFDEITKLVNTLCINAEDLGNVSCSVNRFNVNFSYDEAMNAIKELCEDKERLAREHSVLKAFLESSYTAYTPYLSVRFDEDGDICFDTPLDDDYSDSKEAGRAADVITDAIYPPEGFDLKETYNDHDSVFVSFKKIKED